MNTHTLLASQTRSSKSDRTVTVDGYYRSMFLQREQENGSKVASSRCTDSHYFGSLSVRHSMNWSRPMLATMARLQWF